MGQLQTAPADERATGLDLYPAVKGELTAGLVCHLAIHQNLTGADQGLGFLSGGGKSAFHQEFVKTGFQDLFLNMV